VIIGKIPFYRSFNRTVVKKYLFLICAFVSGMIFGLSLWFLQAGTQTKVMVKHMSKESVYERINEINT